MVIAKLRNGFGSDQGSVAGKHEHVIVGGEGVAAHHQSMPSAPLFCLENEPDAVVLDRILDSVRFVTNDGEDVGRGDNLLRRVNHVLQKRFTTDLVKDLGQLGFQTRALARRENGDGEAGGTGGFSGFGRFSSHAIGFHVFQGYPSNDTQGGTEPLGAEKLWFIPSPGSG